VPAQPQKWQLYDQVSGTSYVCQINPSNEQVTAQKTLQFEATAAPGGQMLLYEGTDAPDQVVWSGTILSESQYFQFRWFHSLRRQFQVTDDLGRVRWVYSTEFQPTRVRSATYLWKVTYQWTLYVFSEVLPTPANEVFNANPVIG